MSGTNPTQFLYLGIQELQARFDFQYTFGTYGTSSFASVDFGTYTIGQVSAEIDSQMQMYYGSFSPIFGTNSIGTLDVPEVVKSCVANLSMARCLRKKQLGISDKARAYIEEIEKEGQEELENLLNPINNIQPFAGTKISYSIETPGAFEQVRGELRSFSGTNIVPLGNRNVIKDTVRVYGTQIMNPTVYVQDVDYKVWGFGADYQGTLMGCIAGIGTVGSLGQFSVYVDYKYQKNPAFIINDNYKWGMMKKEWRG